MTEENVSSTHWSFWVVGAFALLWNGLGAVNYLMQVNADTLAMYREAERAVIESRPAWATAGFAIAMFGGTLGSILLLLKKSAAFYVFIVSLLGVILTAIHTAGVDYDLSTGEIVAFAVMPLVVAAFLVWYSKLTERKGWIG